MHYANIPLLLQLLLLLLLLSNVIYSRRRFVLIFFKRSVMLLSFRLCRFYLSSLYVYIYTVFTILMVL